jgi:hypothetical protein
MSCNTKSNTYPDNNILHHSLHTINDSLPANSNQDKLSLQVRYSTQKRTDSLPVNSNQDKLSLKT